MADPATTAAVVKIGLDVFGAFGKRTKTQDRPVAEKDLRKLVERVRTNPSDYDEAAEFQALMARNRPGARQQIANRLQAERLSIFAPTPPPPPCSVPTEAAKKHH